MKNLLTIIINMILISTLTACASKVAKTAMPNTSDASLAEASYAVSRSMSKLSETEQAAYPMLELPAPGNPADYGMGGRTSVDWSGPIEPMVKEIARMTGYHLQILGNKPAIPILISIYNENTMIGNILRDIGYQSGKRATIAIYPEDQIIELRYASN